RWCGAGGVAQVPPVGGFVVGGAGWFEADVGPGPVLIGHTRPIIVIQINDPGRLVLRRHRRLRPPTTSETGTSRPLRTTAGIATAARTIGASAATVGVARVGATIGIAGFRVWETGFGGPVG